METPQLNALSPGCSPSCHGFVGTLNDAIQRVAGSEMLATITDETVALDILQAVAEKHFRGPEIEAVIAEHTGTIAIRDVMRPEDPITYINAMDTVNSCAVDGCKLARAALLLNLPRSSS